MFYQYCIYAGAGRGRIYVIRILIAYFGVPRHLLLYSNRRRTGGGWPHLV